MTHAKRPRVLFVDDSSTILAMYERALKDRFDVFLAHDGDTALRILDDNNIDILICDLYMPGMDGATVCKRASEISPKTVRMMLTGSQDSEDLKRAVVEGQVLRYLIKPFKPIDLADVIEEVMPRTMNGKATWMGKMMQRIVPVIIRDDDQALRQREERAEQAAAKSIKILRGATDETVSYIDELVDLVQREG